MARGAGNLVAVSLDLSIFSGKASVAVCVVPHNMTLKVVQVDWALGPCASLSASTSTSGPSSSIQCLLCYWPGLVLPVGDTRRGWGGPPTRLVQVIISGLEVLPEDKDHQGNSEHGSKEEIEHKFGQTLTDLYFKPATVNAEHLSL